MQFAGFVRDGNQISSFEVVIGHIQSLVFGPKYTFFFRIDALLLTLSKYSWIVELSVGEHN